MNFRFEITFQTEQIQKVCEYMSDVGVGWDKKDVGIKYVITFENPKNPPVQEMKDLIKLAYEKNGCKVLKIEGGVVE